MASSPSNPRAVRACILLPMPLAGSKLEGRYWNKTSVEASRAHGPELYSRPAPGANWIESLASTTTPAACKLSLACSTSLRMTSTLNGLCKGALTCCTRCCVAHHVDRKAASALLVAIRRATPPRGPGNCARRQSVSDASLPRMTENTLRMAALCCSRKGSNCGRGMIRTSYAKESFMNLNKSHRARLRLAVSEEPWMKSMMVMMIPHKLEE